MYADDTIIFYSNKDLKKIEEHLSRDFHSFATWLACNELIINTKIGKTETMLFGMAKRLAKANQTPFIIKHQGTNINHTNNYKYLGLNINSTLCMTEHIRYSLKKASGRVTRLKKIRYFIDSKTAVVYQSIILPIIASFATYLATPNYMKENILSVENRAEKIIGGSYVIPRSETVKRKRICAYVHRCLHGEVCDTFKDYFTIKQKRFSSRISAMVNIPKFKLELYELHFTYKVQSYSMTCLRKCEWGTTARSLRVCLKKFDRMSQPTIPIVGQPYNLRADVCTSYTLRVRVSLHRTKEKSFIYFLFCDVALSH